MISHLEVSLKSQNKKDFTETQLKKKKGSSLSVFQRWPNDDELIDRREPKDREIKAGALVITGRETDQ